MLIGQLATRVGVRVQTVRFYEQLGLLPRPQRKESGYRVYAEPDIRRMLFIRQAKSLGFSLQEIRGILRTRQQGDCPCAEVISIARRHLRELEQQIRHLSKFRQELSRAVRKWKRSGKKRISADAICVLIERTLAPDSLSKST
ncbi:MAG: hypothetical protein DMG31_08265 [Acidobacteria bacterium]|nr:MAG: hypothetical protein DMG31_08265 [Acidobacteriota bacterium]